MAPDLGIAVAPDFWIAGAPGLGIAGERNHAHGFVFRAGFQKSPRLSRYPPAPCAGIAIECGVCVYK